MQEKELTLNEYQRRAMTTCLPSCKNDMYMLFGLVEEVGELMGKIAKGIRKEKTMVCYNKLGRHKMLVDGKEIDCGFTEEELHDIKSEVGDCAWFIAGIARRFGWTLEEVAQYNLDKLAKRKEQGTIVNHTDH